MPLIPPAKLQALVDRENGVKPMAPAEEDTDMELEGEGADEEEDEAAAITPEEIDEIAEMIDAGEGDPMLMQYAMEVTAEVAEFGEDAELPPMWAIEPDIWVSAETAVDPEGAGSKYTEPYAVVAHVYQRLGGTTA